MTLNLTRGGLTPAKIVNLTESGEVSFMFNPYEYTIKKRNSWKHEERKGQNIPKTTFHQGEPQSLSLTLHFDTLSVKEDVRKLTDKLLEMMMVVEGERDAKTGKSAPPKVAFQWGKLHFVSIITDMSQKFTLFMSDGTPVRCEVSITLEQYVDENEFQPQLPESSAPPANAPSTTTMTEGQRLDHMGDHREIASKNNIDNPHNVPPGTNLQT